MTEIEVSTDISPTARNLATFWEGMADAAGDRTAIVQADRQMTWSAWESSSSILAGHLADAGVMPGDRIAMVLYNSTEMFTAVFAAFKLRAIPAGINYRYRAAEIVQVIRDSGARVVVFHGAIAEEIARASVELPGVMLWIEVEDGLPPSPWAITFSEALENDPAPRMSRSVDDLSIMYTGGTTGTPKGVLWSHDLIFKLTSTLSYVPLGLAVPDTVEAMVDVALEQIATGSAPTALISVPLMHGSGLWSSFAHLQIGGQVVLLSSRHFDAGEFLRAVQTHGARSLMIVGDALANPILEELDRAANAGSPYRLGHVQRITSTGVSLSAENKKRFQKHVPNAEIFDAVGGSEGGPFAICVTPPRTEPMQTASHIALPDTVLVDDDLRVVPWGTLGQFNLAYRGPLPLGYLGDPEKTAARFPIIDGTRHLLTGDIAEIDGAGTLRLVGRDATCINTGGEKVYTTEVEESVKQHPDVEDCLAVGIPDASLGSAVTVVVKPRKDRTIDTGALRAYCHGQLAGYKVPRHIVVVDEIRRSPAGKSDYRWAREAALCHLDSS